MPTVKDKTTGQVVAELPYDAQGKAKADQMVQASPNLEIDYAPGGASDAMARSTTTYLEGGKIMPYAVAPILSEIPEEEDLGAKRRADIQMAHSTSRKRKKIKAIDSKKKEWDNLDKNTRAYYKINYGWNRDDWGN
jgi:hypothetical protein